MDLADDRATAESLFGLLNLIAEKMIFRPKARPRGLLELTR